VERNFCAFSKTCLTKNSIERHTQFTFNSLFQYLHNLYHRHVNYNQFVCKGGRSSVLCTSECNSVFFSSETDKVIFTALGSVVDNGRITKVGSLSH
jgi:hypothetical protein